MNMVVSIPDSHLLPGDLYTGIAQMDREHAALFDSVLGLKSALVEQGLVGDEVRQRLFQLQMDVSGHFSSEERMAHEAGLNFYDHGHEHRRLIHVFDRQLNDLLQGRSQIPAFLAFVDHWFENHIRKMDIPFGKQLAERSDN